MKKTFSISLIFLMLSFTLVAQRKNVREIAAGSYPSVSVRLLCDRYRNITQQYTAKFENLSNNDIRIQGTLVAILVCGKEKSTNFNAKIKGHESSGGSDFIGDADGMTGVVYQEDCKTPEKIFNSESKLYEENRIRTLELRNVKVTDLSFEEKEEKGDDAMSVGNFEEALQYYKTAQLGGINVTDKITKAQAAIDQKNQDRKNARDKEDKEISEKAKNGKSKNKNKEEVIDRNVVNANMMKMQDDNFKSNATSIFSLNTGTDQDDPTLSISFGLPFENIPVYSDYIVTNTGPSIGSTQNSSASNTAFSYVGLQIGLEYNPIKTKYFDLGVHGSGSYSSTILMGSLLGSSSQTDAQTTYLDYNLGGSIAIGVNGIKAFGDYTMGQRSATNNLGNNQTMGSYNSYITTTSNNANCKFSNYSAGIKVSFDDDEERFVKLRYINEQAELSKSGTSTFWGFGIDVRYWVDIKFSYYPKYAPWGTYNYPLTNPNDTQSFWLLSIGRSFKIL